MNEKGVVYNYSFFMEEQENFVWGAMAIHIPGYMEEEYDAHSDEVVFSSLGGYDIFDSGGEDIVLTLY